MPEWEVGLRAEASAESLLLVRCKLHKPLDTSLHCVEWFLRAQAQVMNMWSPCPAMTPYLRSSAGEDYRGRPAATQWHILLLSGFSLAADRPSSHPTSCLESSHSFLHKPHDLQRLTQERRVTRLNLAHLHIRTLLL